MKTQSMSIREFMNQEKKPVKTHFEKYGIYYKAAGISLIFITTCDVSFAAGTLSIPTAGSMDPIGPAARGLYSQLVNIGKWIIVFKGGFETIKSMGNGDVDAAKKNFFGYLLSYLFLLGLPYGMDKVDQVFNAASAGK